MQTAPLQRCKTHPTKIVLSLALCLIVALESWCFGGM